MIAAAIAVVGVTGVVADHATPAAQSKTEPGAPWPTMRHDLRNTGASEIRGLDGHETVVLSKPASGSSPRPDRGRRHHLRRVRRSQPLRAVREGEEVWRFETGEIIDTAFALLDDDTLIIGSGDENMYKVSTDPGDPLPPTWRTFKPTLPTVEGQLVNWWDAPERRPGRGHLGNTGGGARTR